MRVRGAVTTLSWIPSEAVTGMLRSIFDMGVTHYDPPPAERVTGLVGLRRDADADAFRFANHLSAWAEVRDGVIVSAGHTEDSTGVMGGSTLRLGPWSTRMAAAEFPLLQAPCVITPSSATFVQTYGGHAAMPAPRRVDHPPYVQVRAPLVWTTLELTLHADGRVTHALPGASRFPRHWVYGPDGRLVAKSGLTEFDAWYRTSFGAHSPWGDEHTPALVTTAEAALERSISATIMREGARPTVRTLEAGVLLTRQGEPGDELYLLLDGVLRVEVDGRAVGELGPGSVVGERALLEGGLRTSTLVAVTDIRVAVVGAHVVDREALARLSEDHRREHVADEPPREGAEVGPFRGHG